MRPPTWLTLLVAALVFIWGAYRIRLAFDAPALDDDRPRKKGLFGLPRRRHFLYGVVYLILAGLLVATAFGWRPIVIE